MPIVPVNKPEFLQFCTDHITPWQANAVAIGLTSTQVTDWKNLVSAAQTAYNAASSAREAARSATMASNQAISAARAKTAELVRLIKNQAVSTGDDNVYVLAQVPEPADPSSLPPPGQPFMLAATLEVGGALTVSWKSNNPEGSTGTFYLVRRRLSSSGPFTFIGGSGSAKRFTDATVPAGTAVVQYQVQGQRGSLTGPSSETFTVNLGVGGGGQAFIASTSGGGGGGSGSAFNTNATDENGEEDMKLAA